MKHHSTRLSYQGTGFFSSIVTDYLAQTDTIRPFYEHSVDLKGIQDAIQIRKKFSTPRAVLVESLLKQYEIVNTSEPVLANIKSLGNDHTFTVVTAHQPNIFTGPLYFIYKILHTIQLAKYLSEQLPDYRFVPVYYMGSEDADLDELGQISLDGHKLKWATSQKGAVGRMKVDKELIQLLQAIEGQTGVLPYGKQLSDLFRQAYTMGRSIQEATLDLVNTLFGSYGLVVLIPDNAAMKATFSEVVKKELLEGFSHGIVNETSEAIGKHYKVQAGGREINLFYLIDDIRERIERDGEGFLVNSLNLRFSREEILAELETHPERFSPNVILRGAFQETILPNIAFIGGGGELAYWLELKDVFAAIAVPYPVLVLRNSFLLFTSEQEKKMNQLGFNHQDIFQPKNILLEQLVRRSSDRQLGLAKELNELAALYNKMKQQAGTIDTTLMAHVDALGAKAAKRVEELEKKMLRAEKRKFEAEGRQIESLKAKLFPGDSLQERVENFSTWYGKYGTEWITMLAKNSLALEAEFVTITIE